MLLHNVVHTQGVQMMYIGSLMVALAVEESGLHRRIALNALSLAVKISENCWQPLVCCLVFFCGKDTYLNDVTVENFLTSRERVQPTWCSGSCFPPPSSPCGSATPPPLPWWSLCFATLRNIHTYHRCRLFKQSSLNWHLTGFRIRFSNIRDNPRTKSCYRFWKHEHILFL